MSESCPRCQGYMHISSDQYGAYRECLHCGYLVDVVDAGRRDEPRRSPPTTKRRRAA